MYRIILEVPLAAFVTTHRSRWAGYHVKRVMFDSLDGIPIVPDAAWRIIIAASAWIASDALCDLYQDVIGQRASECENVIGRPVLTGIDLPFPFVLRCQLCYMKDAVVRRAANHGKRRARGLVCFDSAPNVVLQTIVALFGFVKLIRNGAVPSRERLARSDGFVPRREIRTVCAHFKTGRHWRVVGRRWRDWRRRRWTRVRRRSVWRVGGRRRWWRRWLRLGLGPVLGETTKTRKRRWRGDRTVVLRHTALIRLARI